MQHVTLRSSMLLSALLLLTGVGFAQVSVTDHLGREVALPGPAVRIVSLMPSHTETLLALGAADLLVGVDEASPLPAGHVLPRLGNGFSPNIELIVGLEPDLVLTDSYSGVHDQLDDLGVTTFAGTPETLAQVLAFNATLGDLTGKAGAAAELTLEQQAEVDRFRSMAEGLPRPLVFIELDPTPFSAGPGSYADDLLQVAGGRNIVPAEMGSWPLLSAEFVLASEPELVLLLDAPWGETEASFRSRPGFSEMTAEVIEVSEEVADLLSRPGPGLVDALEWLFSVLHSGAAGE